MPKYQVSEKNKQRARRAWLTLEHYKREIMDEGGYPTADDLVDLLSDLRHWAEQHTVRFEQAVKTSQMHFDAEKTGRE